MLSKDIHYRSAVRAAELRAAAAVLGVRETVILGYPDGGLA